MAKQTYCVYVILLNKEVLNKKRFTARSPEYDPDLAPYYVGMTAHTPEERFAIHLEGGMLSCTYVRKHGIQLEPELYEHLPRFTSREEAKAKEKELAVDLREEGHAAYWNGDDQAEEESMGESKENTLRKMDAAAEKAGDKLASLLSGLSPEEREGARKIIVWFKDNYMDAGYKRLGKILKGLPD